MSRFEQWEPIDLMAGPKKFTIKGGVFAKDAKSHRLGLIVSSNHAPVTMTGTIQGIAKLPPHTGNSIEKYEFDGVIDSSDSSRVYIDVPAEALYYPGQLTIAIRNNLDNARTVLATFTGWVDSTTEGTPGVPPSTLPDDIEDFIAELSVVRQEIDGALDEIEAKGEEVLASIPEDYTSLSQDVSDLKSAVDDIVGGYKYIGTYPQINGMINSSGNWANVNANYQHIAIPIASGDAVTVVGNDSTNTIIAFLTSHTTPVSGAASFSSATGFTSRIQLTKGASYSYTVPSDALYLYVSTTYNGNLNSLLAKKIVINGFDLMKKLGDAVIGVLNESGSNTTRITNAEVEIDSLQASLNYTMLTALPENPGSIKDNGDWGNTAIDSGYKHYAVPVNPGDRIMIRGSSDYSSNIAFLRSYTVANNTPADFSTAAGFTSRIILDKGRYYDYIVPSDCHYLYTRSGNLTPTFLSVNYINIIQSLMGTLSNMSAPKIVNWCAMGDSITKGYYSFVDEGVADSAIDNQRKTWARLVALYNSWDITNIAVGGSGYLYKGGGSRGYLLARATDFTPYNLVTLAYGINDWKGNQVIGTLEDDPTLETQTTVIGAMKATIEAIMESNPACKIIVILPLNCQGYNHDYGDETTNYARGYNFSNSGTLDEFSNALISVCNYYGIQYVDMTRYSCINRKNLPDMLPDGVHPSLDCHALLAAELSKKITF